MGTIKKYSYMIKTVFMLALITCLILIFWIKTSDDQLSDQNLLIKTPQGEEVKSNIQENVDRSSSSNVKQINDAADILALAVGEKFSLLTEFNGEYSSVFLEVFNVAKNSKFTQFQSKGTDGSVAVVTLTPTMTSILLKTPNNIYEYAGNEFNGILDQVASLGLSNDIREKKPLLKPINGRYQPKKVSEQ